MKEPFKIIFVIVLLTNTVVASIIMLSKGTVNIMIVSAGASAILAVVLLMQSQNKEPYVLDGFVDVNDKVMAWKSPWSFRKKGLGYRIDIIFKQGVRTRLHNTSTIIFEGGKLLLSSKLHKQMIVLRPEEIKRMVVTDDFMNNSYYVSEGHADIFTSFDIS